MFFGIFSTYMPTYTCAITGESFALRPEDVDFSERMDVPVPNIHPDEMLRQAMACRNEWNLYHRSCDKTGEPMIAVYDKDVPFPVYKNDIWWGDSWDALEYGQDVDLKEPFSKQFKTLQNKVPREGVSVVRCENCDYNLHTRDSKNCYLCSLVAKSEDLHYCDWIIGKDCVDSHFVVHCELCYECVSLRDCYHCIMSQELFNCSDCFFSYQLRGCNNCIGCSNLANKSYYVFNKKVSQKEFEDIRDTILNGSYKTWKQGLEFYKKMWKTAKHRALHNVNCENVVGDVLLNCKNMWHSFEGYDGEDIAYSISFGEGSKDVYYSHSAGWEACELIYNSGVSRSSTDLLFCYYTFHSSSLSYCDSCSNCKDCFGCIGLKHKQYCILNKQYTKDEYEQFVPKIIEHMKQTGEWGNLGVWFTSYAYNQTAAHQYFPLTKEEALGRGYTWKEDANIQKQKNNISEKYKISDSINDIDNSVCKETLVCEKTGKPYKVMKSELEFYKKMNLPLPRFCPEARREQREERRNPYRLFKRTCDVSGKEIWTTFAPERSETIVSEDEYFKSIK